MFSRDERDPGAVLCGQNGHIVRVRGATADGVGAVPHGRARAGHEPQLGSGHAGAHIHPASKLLGKGLPDGLFVRVQVKMYLSVDERRAEA